MVRTALVAALLLGGCASSVMKGYIGQPLQTVMIDHGPPANAFDMPDGTRAFQWVKSKTYVMPTTVNQTGNAYAYGPTVNWQQRTQIVGGQPITSECAYTMFARWDESQQAWVFTSFRKPKFTCE